MSSQTSERVAAHRPLPWTLDKGKRISELWDADGSHVAEGLWLADAEFVIRACNNYYDLLAALKALLADIDSGLLVRDITRDGEPGWAMHMLHFVQRMQAAQAAIAKAEGR